MKYKIEFKPRAVKDLRPPIDTTDGQRIVVKIKALENDLAGGVKHLNNFTSAYRLRVGNYRVLFEIEMDTVMICRIKHRKDVYS